MRRMKTGLWVIIAVLAGSMLGPSAADAQKKTLVVALNQDPDILDPTLSRTYVGRIVFAQMCEKLYEIDEGLQDLPAARRRAARRRRRRQDGDDQAAAGRQVQRRHADERRGGALLARPPPEHEGLQPAQRARVGHGHRGRRSAHGAAEAQGAVLPARRHARRPRGHAGVAGPANKLGDKFGTAPVCVGPWQFVERVPQDRIVLERSPHYFDPGAARVRPLVFRIIPDDNVRLANLRSGDIDFMHLVAPTDVAEPQEGGAVRGLERDGHRLPAASPSTCATRRARRTRRAISARRWPTIRACARRWICRSTAQALNQVAYDGQYTPGCTPISPNSAFYDKTHKCPARDVAKAKKLLADAGLAGGYSFEMVIVNDPQQRRVGEVIQGMAKEAGFNISLRPAEFASALKRQRRGQARGVSHRLERPRGSGRQHPPVPHLRRAASTRRWRATRRSTRS